MSLVTKISSWSAVYLGAGRQFLRALGGLSAWAGGSFRVGSGQATILTSQNSSWGEAVKLGKLVRMSEGRKRKRGFGGRRHGRIPYGVSLRKIKGSQVRACSS